MFGEIEDTIARLRSEMGNLDALEVCLGST